MYELFCFTMSTCACVYSRLCVRQSQYIFGFPFNITWLSASSASRCGGVKGCWVRWSQQEATSVVWCLTRMDCVTDAHGVHSGFPGHATLALRSAGVRGSLELSPPTDSRKPINFKHQLIIWGVIANQMDPSCSLKWTLFLSCWTRCHFPFCSPFLFAICLTPSFWLHLSSNCDEDISFCLCRNQNAAVQQGWSKHDNMIHRFIMCVTVHVWCSWVPADKHTTLHRASCLESTVAVFVETV